MAADNKIYVTVYESDGEWPRHVVDECWGRAWRLECGGSVNSRSTVNGRNSCRMIVGRQLTQDEYDDFIDDVNDFRYGPAHVLQGKEQERVLAAIKQKENDKAEITKDSEAA